MITEQAGRLIRFTGRRGTSNRGFTLIEIMISMMLLTLVLTAGMGLYYNSNQMTKLVVHKKLATEMVNSKLENLKQDGYSSLPSPGTPEVLNVTVGGLTAVQTTVVSDIDEPVDGTTDYKQVNVQIAWAEAGKNTTRTIESTTFMAP